MEIISNVSPEYIRKITFNFNGIEKFGPYLLGTASIVDSPYNDKQKIRHISFFYDRDVFTIKMFNSIFKIESSEFDRIFKIILNVGTYSCIRF